MFRLTVFIAFVLIGCTRFAAAEGEVTVFAAASLRGALDQIVAGVEDTTGQDVVLSYGGSGTMARQVAAGAPADVVVLASTQWMDWLAARGSIDPHGVRPLTGNRLVVIGGPGARPLRSAQDLPDRLGTARLAMGQRDAVPAGSYARQWLQSAGLWPALRGQLAETDNVRAALVLVTRGAAPFGIVYKSDAVGSKVATVVWHIPTDSHDPIVYPAAALTPQGEAFLEHLFSPTAQDILASHGFSPVRP